jgi:hypothetical protein
VVAVAAAHAKTPAQVKSLFVLFPLYSSSLILHAKQTGETHK